MGFKGSALGLMLIAGCAATGASTVNEDVVSVETDVSSVSAETDISSVPIPRTEVDGGEPELVAQAVEPDWDYFADERGLAIRGVDPVAYFTEGAAVAGRAEYTYRWGNATWQFASAENRDRFVADPEQFAPAYGGFCAWAVSQGYTAAIDPEAWRIVDGRLYLNYSPGVQRRWERDIPWHIAQADANWPGVVE